MRTGSCSVSQLSTQLPPPSLLSELIPPLKKRVQHSDRREWRQVGEITHDVCRSMEEALGRELLGP